MSNRVTKDQMMDNKVGWTTTKTIAYLAIVIPGGFGIGLFLYGWYQVQFNGNDYGYGYAVIGLVIAVSASLTGNVVGKIINRNDTK